MKDKKDEIISLQLDLIRKMTENNIKRLSDDIWGSTRTASQQQTSRQTAGEKPKPNVPEKPAAPSDFTPAKPSDEPPVKASDGGDGTKPAEAEEKLPEKENIEDLRKELDSYIGLENVKKEVKNLINMATVYKMRRDNNLPTADISLHMVFSGNPGTGKTMIARFMARVYHSLGILSKGQLVEVDRSGLVAGYIGQTAIKTAKVLEGAIGGVLFIDEAYTLTAKTENDFGFEAVDTILKSMEDNRDDLVVIVAGYTDEMHDFLTSNPGLISRFNKYIDFPDYTDDELMAILAMNAKKQGYVVSDEANAVVREMLTKMTLSDRMDFGNARGMRNTLEKLVQEQANRLAQETGEVTREMLERLEEADARVALEMPRAEEEKEEEA